MFGEQPGPVLRVHGLHGGIEPGFERVLDRLGGLG